MAFFTEPEIAALLAMENVSAAMLVEAHFKTKTMRVSDEAVPFTSTDGKLWEPLGQYLGVTASTAARGTGAQSITYSLSLIDPNVALLASQEDGSEYKGRSIIQYIQFFGSTGEPVGAPKAVNYGIMDTISVTLADGVQRLELKAGDFMERRNAAPFGLNTDADQKARHPGDRFMERAPTVVNATRKWPDFA